MSKYLKLEIPNSCHQDWHTMLPEERGRYCLSCQKKVVDFTQMSDKELTQYFRQPQEATCGRFTASQLGRELAIPPKPQPWVKYCLQAALPAFLLSLKAAATTYRLEYSTYLSPLQREVKDTGSLPATVTVEGTIRDEQGNGIPYATVILKGTQRGVQADSVGFFVFPNVQASALLVISSVGYTAQEIQVKGGQPRLQLTLQLDAVLMGEVVTVGYVAVSRYRKKERKAIAIDKPKKQIRFYPNPLTAGKSISLQCHKLEYGSYVLQLFNAAGTQVYTEKVAYTKGMTLIQVQPPHLTAGHYFLKLTQEKNGESWSEQLLVIQ